MNSRDSLHRVSLHTLGCKLNYAETSAIGDRFRGEGYHIIPFGEPSDVIVINSCTVTENADRECRQLVRRALRANPDAFVVVTGCYAQLQPEEIASIEGVDLVLGAAEKFRLFELAGGFAKRDVPKVVVGDIANEESFGPAYTGADDARTRAFLKVQDGCDYNCSFCTIPLARGGSRSQPVEDAWRQACELVANGFREIVITGVNVGDFGKARGESLYDLLVRLHDVPGLERMRISSIEPNLLTDRIIHLAAASDRMLPHFHVPLQSGSDAVLGRMRRRYRSSVYRDRVERIVAAMPDAAIGVDVIVGFPGESDTHFQETYDFLHALPVAYLHVFTYSERENTPASAFEGVVPVAERRNRTRMLRTLSEKKRAAFAVRHCGEERSVLFEHGSGSGTMLGFTENYIRVGVPYNSALANRIVRVRLGEFQGDYCTAGIVSDISSFVDADSAGIPLPVLNIIQA
ncbi:MAG TPA: tRNA (N(6)-L-threonylcarbamoyladenosine(37)-C(2))-methylthiotransferase MtaB [Candidatus Kapabacteria bacterium]|nr:tRNA (N(6)-L-threonylcarbamoyladenosine(37)-C(2))-methylthiotransferase MtaB [Candidatus Kapabacteria bacterium]